MGLFWSRIAGLRCRIFASRVKPAHRRSSGPPWIALGIALALLLVEVSPATASTIKIIIGGKATQDGVIKVDMQTEPLDDDEGTPITGITIQVSQGQDANTVAGNEAAKLNGISFYNENYFPAITKAVQINNVAYTELILQPLPGTPDYTKGTVSTPPGEKDPGLTVVPEVALAAPGNTSLQFTAAAAPDPTLFIDWNLYVVSQDDSVIADSALAGVPDTTDATTLISLFAANLLGKGIPVVADGGILSLTTSDNEYLLLTSSAVGSLSPSVSDEVIPEPNTFSLLFCAGAAVFAHRKASVLRKGQRAG